MKIKQKKRFNFPYFNFIINSLPVKKEGFNFLTFKRNHKRLQVENMFIAVCFTELNNIKIKKHKNSIVV